MLLAVTIGSAISCTINPSPNPSLFPVLLWFYYQPCYYHAIKAWVRVKETVALHSHAITYTIRHAMLFACCLVGLGLGFGRVRVRVWLGLGLGY